MVKIPSTGSGRSVLRRGRRNGCGASPIRSASIRSCSAARQGGCPKRGRNRCRPGDGGRRSDHADAPPRPGRGEGPAGTLASARRPLRLTRSARGPSAASAGAPFASWSPRSRIRRSRSLSAIRLSGHAAGRPERPLNVWPNLQRAKPQGRPWRVRGPCRGDLQSDPRRICVLA